MLWFCFWTLLTFHELRTVALKLPRVMLVLGTLPARGSLMPRACSVLQGEHKTSEQAAKPCLQISSGQHNSCLYLHWVAHHSSHLKKNKKTHPETRGLFTRFWSFQNSKSHSNPQTTQRPLVPTSETEASQLEKKTLWTLPLWKLKSFWVDFQYIEFSMYFFVQGFLYSVFRPPLDLEEAH